MQCWPWQYMPVLVCFDASNTFLKVGVLFDWFLKSTHLKSSPHLKVIPHGTLWQVITSVIASAMLYYSDRISLTYPSLEYVIHLAFIHHQASPQPSQAILLSVCLYFQRTTIGAVAAIRTGVSTSIEVTKCVALLASRGREREIRSATNSDINLLSPFVLDV